jgi:hypothetical protein
MSRSDPGGLFYSREVEMKANVGRTERIIRVVVGIVIVGIGVVYGSWWGAVGLVPIATGLTGWCPPYALLGISTCPPAAAKKE